MFDPNLKIFGLAKWRLVPEEPRHDTWHNALFDTSKLLNIDLKYIGLKNNLKTYWITELLPDTILKQFPYIDVFSFHKVIKAIKGSNEQKTLIYIFEGTIFWLFLMSLIKTLVPNCIVVCNLFSSARFDKSFFKNDKIRSKYKIFFYLLNKYKQKNVIITFDTQVMADRASKITGFNFERFPVPSSFSFQNSNNFNAESHHRVLVNMRGFNLENLHILLKESCQYCEFVFPRGALNSVPLQNEFGKYKNARFDDKVISKIDYKSYIDSFDYMIFLYMPIFASINASGRVLDAITRGIPVCVPKQHTESANISKVWGRANLFVYTSLESMIKTFIHPIFSIKINKGEPPFTPRGVINDLIYFFNGKQFRRIKFRVIKYSLIYIILTLHAIVSAFLSVIYQIQFKLFKNFT
jgi:hypothetical protein